MGYMNEPRGLNPDEIEVRGNSVAGHLVEARRGLRLWIQERVRNVPWWMVSVAFHLVVLLIFAAIMMANPSKSEPTVITVIRPHVQDLPKIEVRKPDDKISHQPLKREKTISEEPLLWTIEEESERSETDDDEKSNKAKGESPEFLTNKDLNRQNLSDAIGIGPGGPGKYGGSESGDRLTRKTGTSPAIQLRVKSALIWLARHQSPDGSWGARFFQNQCQDARCQGAGNPSINVGLTGLSLLAFTGAAYTPGSKDVVYIDESNEAITYGEVVRKAAFYLKHIQGQNGALGQPHQGKFMYNHAIATYALADLVVLMKEKYERASDAIFKNPARMAIDFLLQSQNPGKAWRYTPNCGDNDVSITGWCAMALKAAEEAGWEIKDKVWDGIKSHLDEVTDLAYGQVGYTSKGGVSVLGHEQTAFNRGQLYTPPSLTAVGIMMRIFMSGKRKDTVIRNGAGLLTSNLPVWDTTQRGKIDYYYWFYSSYALNQYDGPKGSAWTIWNKSMKDVLSKHQRADGCAAGSWDPIDRWSGEGGRVYATAINALTLEVYYRLRIIAGK